MKEGRKLKSFKEIRAACKGKMADYEIPKAFLPWEGPWPMTVVGKIQTDELAKRAMKVLSETGMKPS
jgi:fatty-acyl-CoA synthase